MEKVSKEPRLMSTAPIRPFNPALQSVACAHQKEMKEKSPSRMQKSSFLNSSSASNITALWKCFRRGFWEASLISKAALLMWLIRALWAQKRCLREQVPLQGQVWTPVADSFTQGWHTLLEEQVIANGGYFKSSVPKRHFLGMWLSVRDTINLWCSVANLVIRWMETQMASFPWRNIFWFL